MSKVKHSNLKIVEQQHEGAVLNSRDRKCTPSDSASRDSRGRVYVRSRAAQWFILAL
jgi:hypothetical protein